MADFYCDHGAYGLTTNRLGLDAPAWGVPQEGDGSTKDAATASSVASVAFASVPTTGTISVCGVTVATTSVIGAASVDAAANALATNINATTTAVGATVAIGLPQLRNLVFARGPSGGAPAGTCQIMMRVGSATLNHASNSSVAIATTFSAAPALVQFTGGSGGCWGWILNPVAIGAASSIAVAAYGLLRATPTVWTVTPTADDITYLRSGTNPVIAYTVAGFTLTRSVLWPIHIVVDTNTVWTGDSAAGVVTFNLTSSNAFGALWSSSYSTYSNVSAYQSSISCLRKHALVFNTAVTGVGAIDLAPWNAAHAQIARVTGVLYADVSTGTNAAPFSNSTIGTGGGAFNANTAIFVNCTFRRVNPVANSVPLVITMPSNSFIARSHRFVGCNIEANVSGATAPPIINLAGASSGGSSISSVQSFEGCKFTGWAAGNDKFLFTNAAPVSQQATRFVAKDCDGLTFSNAFAGLATSGYAFDHDTWTLLLHNPKQGGAFRYESQSGVSDFDPDAAPAQPTFAATQPNGQRWSLRTVWLATTDVVTRGLGYTPPVLRTAYLDASAIRTVRLELLMRSTLLSALRAGDINVLLAYTSSVDGRVYQQLSNALPVASSASWYDVPVGFTAVAYSFTTANAIAQGCEISLRLQYFGSPRTAITEAIYADPEFSVL